MRLTHACILALLLAGCTGTPDASPAPALDSPSIADGDEPTAEPTAQSAQPLVDEAQAPNHAPAPLTKGHLIPIEWRTSVGPHHMLRIGVPPNEDSGDPAIQAFPLTGAGPVTGSLTFRWDDESDRMQSLSIRIEAGCLAVNCSYAHEGAGASPVVVNASFEQADWINITIREHDRSDGPLTWGASFVHDIHVAGVLLRDGASSAPPFVLEGGMETPLDQNCEHGGRAVPVTGSTWTIPTTVEVFHVGALPDPDTAFPCFQLWGPDGRLLWATQAPRQAILRGPFEAGDYVVAYFGLGPSIGGTFHGQAFAI